MSGDTIDRIVREYLVMRPEGQPKARFEREDAVFTDTVSRQEWMRAFFAWCRPDVGEDQWDRFFATRFSCGCEMALIMEEKEPGVREPTARRFDWMADMGLWYSLLQSYTPKHSRTKFPWDRCKPAMKPKHALAVAYIEWRESQGLPGPEKTAEEQVAELNASLGGLGIKDSIHNTGKGQAGSSGGSTLVSGPKEQAVRFASHAPTQATPGPRPKVVVPVTVRSKEAENVGCPRPIMKLGSHTQWGPGSGTEQEVLRHVWGMRFPHVETGPDTVFPAPFTLKLPRWIKHVAQSVVSQGIVTQLNGLNFSRSTGIGFELDTSGEIWELALDLWSPPGGHGSVPESEKFTKGQRLRDAWNTVVTWAITVYCDEPISLVDWLKLDIWDLNGPCKIRPQVANGVLQEQYERARTHAWGQGERAKWFVDHFKDQRETVWAIVQHCDGDPAYLELQGWHYAQDEDAPLRQHVRVMLYVLVWYDEHGGTDDREIMKGAFELVRCFLCVGLSANRN